MYSKGPPHIAEQKLDDQLEHTYSSYVRIRDVALKTCQRRWTIGRNGERGSMISVQAARHDNDDDDSKNILNSTLHGNYSFATSLKVFKILHHIESLLYWKSSKFTTYIKILQNSLLHEKSSKVTTSLKLI